MSAGLLILMLVAVAALAHVLWCVLGNLGGPVAENGPEGEGLVVFVESTRFAGICWGRRGTALGLRRAGFRGRFLYWRFHETWRACLLLPVIGDRMRLEREAQRLAEFLVAQRLEFPRRPLHVVGYSAGGYVATRALELLPREMRIDGAAIVHAAFSPWRDLRPAAAVVRSPLVITWSPGDWLILGLGTLLLGTCDRVHTPSIGMIGPRGPGREAVLSVGWSSRLLWRGHTGGHFGAAARDVIADAVAPALWRGAPAAPIAA